MIIENHLLLWALVGAASGLVLGLAGTGGGVISIPILMAFGGYDIKEASGYALLALSVGAAISWFIQRKNTVYPVTFILVVFAGTFAFFTAPLKVFTPHWMLNMLLNITCMFSLYSLWVLRKPGASGKKYPLPYQLKTATIGGAITGFLSTMTGLGGGVVIIPWLTEVTGITFQRAIACSLLTLAITAPLSAWRQETFDLTRGEWVVLIVSITLSSLIIKATTSYIPPRRLILVRKLALTGVIFIAMMKTLATL